MFLEYINQARPYYLLMQNSAMNISDLHSINFDKDQQSSNTLESFLLQSFMKAGIIQRSLGRQKLLKLYLFINELLQP